ncbi:MAG: GntR family transcriptional regulator [Nocardioides sp.]
MPVLQLPAAAPSLADAVVDAVREGVAAGELRPDTTYSVYQLAELLGVSRSPVREGLLKLAEAGLVEISRNRGFRVLLPTSHDIVEIFEIRAALEPAAARRVAEIGSADDLAQLASHLEALDRAATAADESAFWAADRALHDAILRLAGNKRAAAIVGSLRSTTALLGPPTTATGRTLREIHDEHAPIVAAIADRNPHVAELTMRKHLDVTCGLLTPR